MQYTMTTCLAIEFESAISKYKTKNLSFHYHKSHYAAKQSPSPLSIAHITRPKLGLKQYYCESRPPYAGAAVSSTILR